MDTSWIHVLVSKGIIEYAGLATSNSCRRDRCSGSWKAYSTSRSIGTSSSLAKVLSAMSNSFWISKRNHRHCMFLASASVSTVFPRLCRSASISAVKTVAPNLTDKCLDSHHQNSKEANAFVRNSRESSAVASVLQQNSQTTSPVMPRLKSAYKSFVAFCQRASAQG